MHTTVDIYTVDRLTERERKQIQKVYIYVQYELKWCGDYKSI